MTKIKIKIIQGYRPMTKSLETRTKIKKSPIKSNSMVSILSVVRIQNFYKKLRNYAFHAINPSAQSFVQESAEEPITKNVMKIS